MPKDTSMTNIKEAEKTFLGCLLLTAKNGKVETKLQADDFESRDYSCIYKTILKQWREGITPTIVTLHDELSDISAANIAEITSAISSTVNIGYYEKQIYEASKTRLFIKALQIAKEEIDKHTDTDTVIKNLIPALTKVTTARNEAGIKSVTELLRTQFSEIRWIITGLIGEGLTMINGAPKIGKSWFVLNLAIAAATGGCFLGTIKTEKTETLYLALEDTERRIQSRLKKLQAIKTDNLKITTQWRDGYIGLVIIDTLARFTNIEDFNAYAETTRALARLKKIADDLRVSIVVIHHAKKGASKENDKSDWMDAALGSTGLTGATDSTIYIKRTSRENTAAQLYATGRDTADIKYNLKMDNDCGWVITDKAAAPERTQGNGKVDYSKPRG